MLVQLLRRETKFEVFEAVDGAEILAQCIYTTPPDHDIELLNDRIHLKRNNISFHPTIRAVNLIIALSSRN
jgi:chemotaxis response regulator CheB